MPDRKDLAGRGYRLRDVIGAISAGLVAAALVAPLFPGRWRAVTFVVMCVVVAGITAARPELIGRPLALLISLVSIVPVARALSVRIDATEAKRDQSPAP